VALLLELLEVARLELPRELREAEQREALQGVPGQGCGWNLPLTGPQNLEPLASPGSCINSGSAS
jgi:hypothetical protein